MTPIPTVWWLRPVSKAARVGAHSAVVWKRLYFRPFPASRSAVGVAHGPPNALEAPKPTSSSKMTSTLGAPAGGRSGSIGRNFASGSFASKGNAPSYGRSGMGSTSLGICEGPNSYHLSLHGFRGLGRLANCSLDSPAPDPPRCDRLRHHRDLGDRVADDANSPNTCGSERHLSLLRSQLLHRPRWRR